MAKGGFVVNVDGKQMRCHAFKADYDNYTVGFREGDKQWHEVKDWSTLSVHAITKKDAEDIVYDKDHRTVEAVKKDA